ncbi:hexose transporter [Pluteus cervinus]|uniref:Hexose transporter n=1 Tax=Pluteus cervinus TaxID=181527 RepID=A0ACD3AGG8_9AGAR|nr:hexose transporter [Pluteus cervinus]
MGAGPAVSNAANGGFAHLIDDTRPWYKKPRLLLLNFWIALMLITSSTNGYDGSMMNGLQSLPQWKKDFHNPSNSQLGLLNAIQNIGGLAAYPFSPYITDGIGRRRAILLGAFVMIIGVIVQTASHSVGMFIGARFLIGFGLTFAASAAPLLVTEVAYPTQRAQATSMYNTLWYLGSIIAAWATFGTFKLPSSWAWRLPSALQGLPSVIQICLVWFIPESPRWLVSKGREQEALQTLAYYHADGNEQDPLVEYEFQEIKAALTFEREVAANIGWLSLIKNPGNRKRMRIILALAFFSQWSGNGLVSYYLNKVFDTIGITDPDEQLLINGILNIFNFFVAITAGLLCNYAGRRRLFMLSTIGMLLFWTGQTISFKFASEGNTKAGKAVITFIFLYYGAYDLAFTPLIVSYTVEILPYALRAKGFTIFNFAISLSLIFNQYVNPVALGKLGWKYYLVYLVWLMFETVFCFIYIVETKNLTLEETAALFDGEEALANLAHPVVAARSRSSDGGDNEKAEIEGVRSKI